MVLTQKISPKVRLGVYTFLSAAVLVSGCNTVPFGGDPEVAQAEMPEHNEETRKKRMFFQRSEEAYDPVKAHLKARSMVDPSDTAPRHEYTKKVLDPAVLGPEITYVTTNKPPPEERVLEAEPWYSALIPDGDEDEGVKVAEAETQPQGFPVPEKPVAVPAKKGKSQPAIPDRSADKLTQSKAVRSKNADTAAAVTNVRTGEHPGKTRLVLDFTTKPEFSYAIQNDRNLLIFDLPGVRWEATEKKVYSNHPLLLAYIAKPSPDGGTVLAVKLKKDIRIVFDTTYPPSNSGGHRAILDIAAL